MIYLLTKILDERLREMMPRHETEMSAGIDLRACIYSDLILPAGASELIPTGIAISIGNPSIAGFILPRSGMGHERGLVLGNLVGLIDADYQGQIMVSAWNRNDSREVRITPMERIAQLVLAPVFQCCIHEVYSFDPSIRGDGGFGHTGEK